jgi:hypothetical protein
MLVSQFERIRMLDDETFNEFYDRINDIRNSMINLEKKVSDAKLKKKILKSLPEKFRIKVTTIEESKDLDNMKIEELVGSLLIYEFSLPPVKKAQSIALKAAKDKNIYIYIFIIVIVFSICPLSLCDQKEEKFYF